MKYDIDSINKREKKLKIVKIILGIFIVIFLYNMILVGISAVNGVKGLNLFGYKAFVIVSSSMAGSINQGDIIIVEDCKEDEIRKDDIITYKKDGQITTHRVIDIIEKDGHKEYVTKGDNNITTDNENILFENIEGKLILTIPALGNIFIFMQDKLIILIIILIILLFCLYRLHKKEKSEIRREKKEIEKRKYENN